ncbi:MAG TPA: DUF6325 family protein [Thermomicrobiales bacterium]|jgi:uncharacterized membrane protein
MALGPIEMLVVKFPGNQFTGEIAPALAELVDAGTIRVIDFVFIMKDTDGTLTSVELADLPDDAASAFAPVVDDVSGMLSEDDIRDLGGLLDPNSSAGLMLFENAWAAKFAQAVRNAKGEVVLSERIPRQVIEEIAASAGM